MQPCSEAEPALSQWVFPGPIPSREPLEATEVPIASERYTRAILRVRPRPDGGKDAAGSARDGLTTFLVVANIIAVKIVSLGRWEVSVSFIAYPLTFLRHRHHLRGLRQAHCCHVVWTGFALSLLVVLLTYVAGIIPAASFWEGQGAYDDILGSVPRIVLASMIAYLISQNNDVILFHILKKVTRTSTSGCGTTARPLVSQALDSAVFVSIAFAGTVPGGVLWELIYVQYVIKLGIAAAGHAADLRAGRFRAGASRASSRSRRSLRERARLRDSRLRGE